MQRVLIAGACGRMGQVVTGLILKQPDMEVAGGLEFPGHPELGRPLGDGFIASEPGEGLAASDVVVDFTSPSSSLTLLRIAAAQGKSYVLGTTGFSPAERDEIVKLSESLPLFFAPNFSVGVTVLYRLSEIAARLLGDDYDIEVVELHHRRKKDAPSGTARELVRVLGQATGRDRVVCGREGQTGEKAKNEIGVVSIRSGDIVGEHYVILGTEGERVELVHKASSRLAFAQGVIRALRFIAGKPNGLYGMNDLLGVQPCTCDAKSR